MHYAICDIETTGGNPKNSKITEIAIYKHDGEKVIDEYDTLVNPEIPIPPFIVNLTGINDRMVENSPRFFEIAKEIIEFTKDCVFVAHNVGFDYGVLRSEFRSLGFDFRRPHLCTVRSSRHVLPGHDSYSLGKLTRALGIDLIGRHRAGGDALATAKLFGIIYEKDKENLLSFIQEELNPKRLHPNLDIDFLDDIPNKTGVYKFYNDTNQLIYIGKSIHIKKRIEQHLRNLKTSKGVEMQKEIARIDYELTGSELIALLLESQLIKQYTPKYNRALRRNKSPYGLFSYIDGNDYIRLYVGQTAKLSEIPLATFSTKKEGNGFMLRIVDENNLCQKLCDLYKTNSACFQYEIGECKGACIQKESSTSYNSRCQKLIDTLNLKEASFYIIGKGRQKNEKSLVLIKKGTLQGFGYAPFHFNRKKPKDWEEFISFSGEDRDARSIVRLFLRKNKGIEIASL
ncbi:MAG: GIY-YIG nuclease family protein [Flavobacteriales bacterium]|nr:GIY-YIG nuclease family protein [Flavobacteriales bacterium]